MPSRSVADVSYVTIFRRPRFTLCSWRSLIHRKGKKTPRGAKKNTKSSAVFSVCSVVQAVFLALALPAHAERVVPADPLAREAGVRVLPILDSVQDYSRNCQGCHGHTGISVSEVPNLKDRVGYFVHTPEGRRFLVQVPGVALSMLDDRKLAELLNWTLQTYSAAQLPKDFQPYTEQEVAALRKSPLRKVLPVRETVVQGLVEAGVIDSPGRLAFRSLGGTR